MKPGARAVGVAESYTGDVSTLAGAVVRADRVIDGLAFEICTVGGTDATDSICSLCKNLGREDVQHLIVSGIAPAWYNVLDLGAIHEGVDRPVISVSFEESEGLEAALERAFAGSELDERLETYRGQPPRERITLNGEETFFRSVGIDDTEAGDVLRRFTPEGGRPEPVRVARIAARAADRWYPRR